MSTETGRLRDRVATREGFRYGALAGVVVLMLSHLSVLYHVTDVVGGSVTLVLVVAATLGVATLLGRTLGVRSALALTALLLALGFLAYLLSIPQSQLELLSPGRLVADTVALLTGLSVLRLTEAGVWALAIAPGPVFLSWYLAVRGRYVGSVVAGGLALCLFVLTGDASPVTTLAGVTGAAVAVGLGTLERHGGSAAQLETLVVVLATVLVLSASVSAVPGGAAQPLLPGRGSSTVEASLVNADDNIEILGSISLSPKVRFSVESTESQYWATQAFDRYTGSGWVRTGDSTPYTSRLRSPPGASRPLEQSVTAETDLTVLPAAWKPVAVNDGLAGGVSVTPQGNLRPTGTVSAGESYTVQSRVPQFTSEQLRRSGSEYPTEVEARYTQLPESTSQRVRDQAAAIAGGQDNAYDKAVAIEEWLESNKRYSLTVRRPEGNIAESFLFEMDAGYCTYYATTMVTLLRAQDVPARFVVGYTPGEEVSEDRHVVRGLDSHAWVQVYFPDVGWVNFDPTPAGPRRAAERANLAEARQSGTEGVDTEETAPDEGTVTPEPLTPTTNGTNTTLSNESIRESLGATETPSGALAPGQQGTVAPDDTGGFQIPAPSREQVVFGVVALAGVVAGARRIGLDDRLGRFVWLFYQGDGDDPEADVERAWTRLEYLMERRYRSRRDGETPRSYLSSLARHGLDDRVVEVARIYERAHYGPGVSAAEAATAVDRVDALVRERTPLLGRLRS